MTQIGRIRANFLKKSVEIRSIRKIRVLFYLRIQPSPFFYLFACGLDVRDRVYYSPCKML